MKLAINLLKTRTYGKMYDKGEKEINRDNLLKKVVPILLVLTAFLLISEHLQKQEVRNINEMQEVRNINEMDEDKDFDVIDTYDQLKFYEQIESGYGVEQLRKADQYGIQTFENKTIPVMGSKRTVQIHEMWSNIQDIYLLYSVNLLLPDKSPKDVPYLEVDQLTLHNPKEPAIEVNAELYSTNGVENRKRYANDGFVFKNRLYWSIWIQPQLYEAFGEVIGWRGSELEIEHEIFERNLERVERVTLSKLHLTDGEITHEIEKIPLEMTLMHEEKALELVQIDEFISLKKAMKRIWIGLRSI